MHHTSTTTLLPALPLVQKKDFLCKACLTGNLIRTTESGLVCRSCGVVAGSTHVETSITPLESFQGLDFATTYFQRGNYDVIKAQSNTENELDSMSYMFMRYLHCIPNYNLVGEKVQNSIVAQGMNIVDKLIEYKLLGLKSKPEITVCAVLFVLLEREGVSFSEVVKPFVEEEEEEKEGKFSSSVNLLVKLISQRFPDSVGVDIGRKNFAIRALNQLDIEFKYHKEIISLFSDSLSRVVLNGTHYKLVLAVVVLHVLKKKYTNEQFQVLQGVICEDLDINPGTLIGKQRQFEKVVIPG